MTILSYIIVTLLAAFGVAAFMELYKKSIRKGQAPAWEVILIAVLVSFGFAALISFTGLAATFGLNPALCMCIYAVVFFAAQYFLDMKVIKDIVKKALDTMDVEVFIGCVLSKLKLSKEQVTELLKKFDISKETFIATLLKIGFTEKQAEEAAAMFY